MKGYELETERSSLNDRSAFLLGRAAQQWERRGGERCKIHSDAKTICRLFSWDNFCWLLCYYSFAISKHAWHLSSSV